MRWHASRWEVASQYQFALSDIPPSRRQRRLALALAVLLFAATLLSLPYGAVPLARMESFVPMANAILLVADLVAATLLFAQASVLNSRALLVLACGFLFTALMVFAHTLAFPGIFAPNGLLGGAPDTVIWIAFLWTAGIPLAVLAYAVLKRREAIACARERLPHRAIGMAVLCTTLIAAGLCGLVILAKGVLPPIMIDGISWNPGPFATVYALIAALIVAALFAVWRHQRSLLDVWLLFTLVAFAIQMVIDLVAGGRFTVGWYTSRAIGLVEHLSVVLVLLAEASRLYTRSALSVIALRRERENRLTSLYAAASAMAHEVRQPLTGVGLLARATLKRLDRPDSDRAAIEEALNAIVEETHRASEVVVSIRNLVAQQSGQEAEFDLNELVSETISRMQDELSVEQVAVSLTLDEPPPVIVADRVQIKQVLINLVTNALESLERTQGRKRKLALRTSAPDRENVLLEISDSGLGIETQHMAHMFEAFFTTKEEGRGMGLALCRSIVEAHGGTLWATLGEGSGITLHVQLPRLSR